MIWLFIFIVSWGIGAIVCGIAMWFKKYTFAKYVAFIFFGLPVLGLGSEMIQHRIRIYNFEYQQKEVARLCALDGGDKIYKTVGNVQGVFQMRARKNEIQKGLRDQYGMFDPYGWAQGDRNNITLLLAGSGVTLAPNAPTYGRYGYWFVEQLNSDMPNIYKRTYLVDTGMRRDSGYYATQKGDPVYKHNNVYMQKLKSRYGYITEDLTTKEMRDHWIGAGRVKIIDLQTKEVLAERKGYFRASGEFLPKRGDRWSGGGYSMCPFPPNNSGLIGFLHSVLKPPQDFPTNEQLESITRE